MDHEMEYTKAPASNLATAGLVWKISTWTAAAVIATLLILAATLV